MTALQTPRSHKSPPLPDLRVATFDDYPQIEYLESSHGLLTLSMQDWQSIWLDNPLRRRLGENWPIGWVLTDPSNGRIVGSLANIPTRYVYDGRDVIAATGRGWVVSSEYRGIALCLMDEYFNQDGAELFINTTVNSMAVDPFSAFGSVRVPVGDWESAAYWITNYRAFARTALRIKHAPLSSALSYPAGGALKVKDIFSVKSLPPTPPDVSISVATTFDARFDDFWTQLTRTYPGKLLGVRDRETLLWHFAGPLRAGHVWVITASRNNLIRGYCIFKRQDHPPSGLVRMRLVDHQTLEPEENLLAGMLGVALERCAAEGIYCLEHVGCALPKMKVLDEFAPYRRKLPAWPYYYKASDPTLAGALEKPEAWDPSTYDGDASL